MSICATSSPGPGGVVVLLNVFPKLDPVGEPILVALPASILVLIVLTLARTGAPAHPAGSGGASGRPSSPVSSGRAGDGLRIND